MNTTTSTTHEPSVWLGCLACYNEGRLTGRWMSPDDAADMTPEGLHNHPSSHEEMWVMDAEYVPVDGEFGIGTCRGIADAYTRVGEAQWEAFCGYAKSVAGSWDESDPESLIDGFQDAYVGEYDSFKEYADEWASEQIEALQKEHDLSDDSMLVRFFDWQSHARELEMEMTTVKTERYTVHIYRSNS
jgi:antirestriction protein